MTQTLWKNASSVTKRQHTATYDALGERLTDVGGMSQSTAFTYDKNGNVLTITDPLGHVTTQTFDQLNRLSTHKDAATEPFQHQIRQPQPPADRHRPARQRDHLRL